MNPSLHPAHVLAALQAASPTKSVGYPQTQPQQPIALNPAAIQALLYAQHQQARGWPAIEHDACLDHPHGAGVPQLPPVALYQHVDHNGMPRDVVGQQLHPQQLLAFHQAQLAQQAHAQQFYQMVHPPVTVRPPKDKFVYVQQEVKEAANPELVAAIKKRALFVAPPVPAARIRIAQACERCRKRKTKCTGERPKCTRCEKRGFDCEYVEEHRANRTKKAVADRAEAVRQAQGYAMYGQDPTMLVDPSALPLCPPAGASYSSSSGYSVASASSLPPPLVGGYLNGQHLFPQAHPSRSSSSGYPSEYSLPPTPAIMVDGRLLASPQMHSLAPAPPPASRPRASSRAKGRATPIKSSGSSQAMSRSTSAMSIDYPAMLPPPLSGSPSCEACVSEMSHCEACVAEKNSLHPSQQLIGIHESRSMPAEVSAAGQGDSTAGERLRGTQQIMFALSQVLAKQTAERPAAPPSTPNDASTPAVPPPLTRDGSNSSSSSGSAAQTPMDYFSYPHASLAGPCGALSPATRDMMKASESMAAAEAHYGMYPSSSGISEAEGLPHVHEGEEEMRFGEVFQSAFSATSEFMQE
ncbi:hypothetical protein BD413DRAFT_666713 [Trametes elegans]|nr:hypothetical protein BD413DRAFT_666713 [Trametes elegans]